MSQIFQLSAAVDHLDPVATARGSDTLN